MYIYIPRFSLSCDLDNAVCNLTQLTWLEVLTSNKMNVGSTMTVKYGTRLSYGNYV